MALSFIFDAGKGETPQSVAQKRALVQQLLGTGAAPKTFGEGLSALGDGIVANVSGRRANEAETKGQAGANDTFSALTAMLTGQGGATPPRGPQTASDATAALAGGDFMSGLINSESGGNWNALNDEGYGGRLQFGDARLADAARAGVIPSGVTGAAFSQMSPEQQQAVEAWHFADIDQQAQGMGLDRYYGQTIAGVPITPESVKAMAHLGGIGGVQKFVTSGGQYNPADSNGTRLSDYGQRFGGGGQQQAAPAPVQVASLDPSIGMPQAQPAQLPPIGPSGGPQMAAAPQQPGMVPQMPPMQPQAPMAPQQQPMQAAQGPSLQMLMEAAANPWLNEGQRGIVNSMIAQEMQRQDPAYQQNLRAGDLGIQKAEFELNQLRNPGPAKPVFDWQTMPDGTLVRTDKTTGEITPMGQFPKGQDPTSAIQNFEYLLGQDIDAAEATKMAFGGNSTNVNVNMGDGAPGLGKLSTDFGYVLDPENRQPVIDPATGLPTAAPVPGSPAAIDAERRAQMSADQTTQRNRYADVVIEDVERALGLVGNDTAGIASLLTPIPGSNARNLDALLTTVKANVGFDRLQAMREASPTGGALGAVSDFENRQLQSTLGNLEQSQTPEQLTYNLQRFKDTYLDIIHGPGNRPEDGDKSDIDYNAGTAPEGWGGDPSLWKYLSPEDRALW